MPGTTLKELFSLYRLNVYQPNVFVVVLGVHFNSLSYYIPNKKQNKIWLSGINFSQDNC